MRNRTMKEKNKVLILSMDSQQSNLKGFARYSGPELWQLICPVRHLGRTTFSIYVFDPAQNPDLISFPAEFFKHPSSARKPLSASEFTKSKMPLVLQGARRNGFRDPGLVLRVSFLAIATCP